MGVSGYGFWRASSTRKIAMLCMAVVDDRQHSYETAEDGSRMLRCRVPPNKHYMFILHIFTFSAPVHTLFTDPLLVPRINFKLFLCNPPSSTQSDLDSR